MSSDEDQKRIERNVQRAGLYHALLKISAVAQDVEDEKRLEAKAIKIALWVLGVIGVVALSYVFIFSSRTNPPASINYSASGHFAKYSNEWSRKVRAELDKRCTNSPDTNSQKSRVALSTSIKKDGSVEQVIVTKSTGNQALDEAAVQSVLAAAPFAPLSPELNQVADILTITRSLWIGECP